jgi:alkaline phosphatase D
MKLGTDAPVHTILEAGVSRRRFIVGAAGLGMLAVVGDQLLGEPWAYADGPTVGLPPTGTAPEQVHLTWGSDPTTQVTVSWASPGLQAMPKPSLIVHAQHGNTPAATVRHVPYTDGMNLETVHSYHAELGGLSPDTAYTYVINDGTGQIFEGSFTTAPAGRAAFRFTSVGDLSTPTAAHNVSATSWNESSDNAYYTPQAIETQQPLFHLLNGDLCYANLNTNNAPEVWRDFGRNNQVSAANRPWMPCRGNHEIEWGADTVDGKPAADGNGHWNGAHGYASYQARYALPDNGVPGLSGAFYAFRVGTVLFVSLDADDVIYQDGGSFYAPKANPDGSYSPLTATNPAISIPPGTSLYNREYTGRLVAGPDNSLVPAVHQPNRQTQWLEQTLAAAREDKRVDMIVVQMHQCALSSSSAGNGSDLGIRQTWLPLFDRYSVDLVLNGHDHDYERSYPVRGHVDGAHGTVVAPNPGQATGPVDTRLPKVSSRGRNRGGYDGAYDTSLGTVFLTLGGGGTDGPTAVYGTVATDPTTPQAKVITQRNQIYVSGGSYVKNGADAVEPAAWSAQRDTTDAYGFAVFDVDPGSRRGDTTITMTFLHAPTATGGGAPYEGTTSFSVFERILFGRGLS